MPYIDILSFEMILQVQLSKKDLMEDKYPNKLGEIINVINTGTIVLREAK